MVAKFALQGFADSAIPVKAKGCRLKGGIIATDAKFGKFASLLIGEIVAAVGVCQRCKITLLLQQDIKGIGLMLCLHLAGLRRRWRERDQDVRYFYPTQRFAFAIVPEDMIPALCAIGF